jgi:hypothetical protein
VHDANGTIDENYVLAPLISEASGLIELPYDTRVSVGHAKKSIANKGGVHFKVLLNPSLVAGGIVKIESPTVNGVFKLAEVSHSGGNRTQNWYSECQCENGTSATDEELKEDIFPAEEGV